MKLCDECGYPCGLTKRAICQVKAVMIETFCKVKVPFQSDLGLFGVKELGGGE